MERFHPQLGLAKRTCQAVRRVEDRVNQLLVAALGLVEFQLNCPGVRALEPDGAAVTRYANCSKASALASLTHGAYNGRPRCSAWPGKWAEASLFSAVSHGC